MFKTHASTKVSAATPMGKAPAVVTVVAPPKGEVIGTSFDNAHKDGVQCTVTFAGGSTAVGTAPNTGARADDQAAAEFNALTKLA